MLDRSAFLLVHPVTTRTLANFLAFLHLAANRAGIKVSLRTQVADVAAIGRAPILAMGEKLRGLARLPSRSVLWVNWSVLFPVRGVLTCSLSAFLWMRRKRQRFLQNLPAFNRVYDFYPAHARTLAKKLHGLRVEPFPTALYAGQSSGPIGDPGDCDFDVCVVGSQSPRRRRVLSALQSRGLRLSPTSGCLEELISRSRIVLNVHQHRCDNCETHRILSSFAHGRCVVTEPIFALEESINTSYVFVAKYAEIPDAVMYLLGDASRLRQLGEEAYFYYWETLWPHALEWWSRALRMWLDSDLP